MSESPLFDETKDHLLMDPDIPSRNAWFDPDVVMLPAVVPARELDLSADDHLVERTDNGLRPEDAALPQPPQDPRWVPDGNR